MTTCELKKYHKYLKEFHENMKCYTDKRRIIKRRFQ